MQRDGQDNKLDLFLNVINNPDKNFEDLINAGFTADNSELLSKDIYLNDAEIKERYTDSNGTFDLARFDSDYKVISLVQQNLQNLKDYDKQIDFFTYHRDNFLVDESKRRKGYDFEILKAPNPFELTMGMVLLGKSENPTKTAQEIAQGELVHNLKTDTWEESPEDASFFENVLSLTKVLAVYDENGVHEDPITGESVVHKKGDLKFNSNGKPYYETLNGRDVYGRLVLSNFDVLTREDSDWNRYDFFDNDGYNKSVVGSIAKTVAVVAPMFIPYVGPVYTGASVLMNAMGLFGTLGKIANINDWMDPNTAKWFNNLEGWSKSMNTLDSRSEYAKQHMWSLENMIGLVGDVITQLKEQRWIFEYGPLFFNPNWNATKAIASKKGIDFEKLLNNFAKKLYGSKFDELMTTATGTKSAVRAMDTAAVLQQQAKQQAENYFTKSQKISEVLSKLYMTGITTQDGYSEAKAAGADDVTAALYALGYAAGEYAIINSRLGDWIFPEKRVAAEMDRKTVQTLFSSLMKSKPAQNATKPEKHKWVLRVFDSAKTKLSSDYIVGMKSQTQTIMDNMLAGALAEGAEELTEEIWVDVSRALYNTVQYLRGEEESSMKAWDNMLDRYLMSAVGGALGGGITAVDLDVVSLLNKDMTYNEAAQRVITMVRNNEKNHEFDRFMDTVTKMNFGNAEVANGKSSNDLVVLSLRQFKDFVYNVINAENAALSDDHILNKVSKELREDFKWSQLMSPLYKESTDSEGKVSVTPIENSVIGAKILQDINNDLATILGDAASTYVEEHSKTDAEERKEDKAPKKLKEESKDLSKVEAARKHLEETLKGALNYEYALYFLYEYTHMGDRLLPNLIYL